jgi:hypothetical protein
MALKDGERFRFPLCIAHCQQGPAFPQSRIKVPGIFFRYTHADQRTNEPACRRTDTHPHESRCEYSPYDEGTNPRNEERAQQSDKPADDSSRQRPGASAFNQLLTILFIGVRRWFLGTLPIAWARTHAVLGGHSDLLVPESSLFQLADRALGTGAVAEERDNGAADRLSACRRLSYISRRLHVTSPYPCGSGVS